MDLIFLNDFYDSASSLFLKNRFLRESDMYLNNLSNHFYVSFCFADVKVAVSKL